MLPLTRYLISKYMNACYKLSFHFLDDVLWRRFLMKATSSFIILNVLEVFSNQSYKELHLCFLLLMSLVLIYLDHWIILNWWLYVEWDDFPTLLPFFSLFFLYLFMIFFLSVVRATFLEKTILYSFPIDCYWHLLGNHWP